jgi:hypothetical protein
MSSPLWVPEPISEPTSIPISKSTRDIVQRFVRSKRFKSYDEMLRWIVSFVGDVPVGVIHSNISLGYDNGKVQVDLQVNKRGNR